MSPGAKILFVNKGLTSKNLSRSDGVEKARIFSHVQQPDNIRLLHSSSESSPDSDSSGSSSTQAQNECDPAKKSTKRTKRPASKALVSKSKSKSNLQSTTPFPLLSVSIAQLDLCGNASTPITDYMGQVLDFYSGAMLERIYPSKIMADISRDTTLSYATNDVVALNAILCTASGALYMHFGDVKHAYYAMYFKGQAIHHLKQELDRPGTHSISVSTLYAVSLLLWLECLQGDMEAAEAHIKGLDQLVGHVKDVHESPLPVFSTILACSHYCSAMLSTRPVLVPDHPAPAAEISVTTATALSLEDDEDTYASGSRFFDPVNAAALGPTLLRIISKQKTFTTFKQRCASGQIDPTYDEIQHIYNVQMQSDHQLLDMPFTVFNGDLSPIQNAVRLALYINTQPILAVAKPHAAFSRSMTTQLKGLLELSDLITLWNPNHDLLLWVLFVGTSISYEQPEWAWFVSYIAMLVDLLDLRSVSALQTILKEFFYDPRAFDQLAELIWRDLQVVLCDTEV